MTAATMSGASVTHRTGALGVEYYVGPRACGLRLSGGVYIEVSASAEDIGGGHLLDYLLDPPVIVPSAMALSNRGMTMFEKDGVFHLLDHVGSSYYPAVQDFIEEVRAHGISRRVQSTIDFSKLTDKSKLILSHSQAFIVNAQDYRPPDGTEYHCPNGVHMYKGSPQYTGMCVGILREDIDPGRVIPKTIPAPLDWTAVEAFPSSRTRECVVNHPPGAAAPVYYAAADRPLGVVGEYKEAFFAAFPIGRITMVGATTPTHKAILTKMKRSGLPVAEEDS